MSFSEKVEYFIKRQSGCSLLDLCRHFGYYSLAVKIMGLDENDAKNTQMAIKHDKDLFDLYTRFNKDKNANLRKGKNRTWTHYFKDLIVGWILEDLTFEMLMRQGLDIRHNGKDRKRVIDIGDEVSQDADALVVVGNNTRLVEFTNEDNDYLERCGYIEKRSPALIRLWKEKAIWVYRDLLRGKYVMVDFGNENITLHLRLHSFWDKDVHRYVLAENNKKERDDRLLSAELISIVGCGLGNGSLKELEDEDSPPKDWSIGGKRRNDIKVEETAKVHTNEPAKKVVEVSKPTQQPKPIAKKEELKPIEKPQPVEEDSYVAAPIEDMDYGDGDFV